MRRVLVEAHQIPVQLEATSFSRLFDSPTLVELLLSTGDHSKSARTASQPLSEENLAASRTRRDEPVLVPRFLPSLLPFTNRVFNLPDSNSGSALLEGKGKQETRKETHMRLLLVHRSHGLLVLPLLLPLVNLKLPRSSFEVPKSLAPDVHGLVDDVVEEILIVRGDDDGTVAFRRDEVLF